MPKTQTPETVIEVRCCRITDPGMGTEEATEIAGRFKALADPIRVRVVNLLAAHSTLCVCELQEHFELSQPTISHHLAILRKAGMVDTETRGRWAFYRIRPEAITELHGILEGHHAESKRR
jgi:ArsR family transcriptional regulator, arsenate/arsenite/antimonite-responsive transcriptional repressor